MKKDIHDGVQEPLVPHQGLGFGLSGSAGDIKTQNHGKRSAMTIPNCPMCHAEIPPEETAKSCFNCGADLTRWIPKPPPVLATLAEAEAADPAVVTGSRLGLGVLGAFLGAIVGAVAMFGFYKATNLRFPLLGVGIGLLTGYAAKWFNKGADNTLGMISGGFALVAVVGTLFLMYGEFPAFNIISAVVSVSVAYKIAAR
jgi:hypothetical protein